MSYRVRYLQQTGNGPVWATYSGETGREGFRSLQGADRCARRLLADHAGVTTAIVKAEDRIVRWYDRVGGQVVRGKEREARDDPPAGKPARASPLKGE